MREREGATLWEKQREQSRLQHCRGLQPGNYVLPFMGSGADPEDWAKQEAKHGIVRLTIQAPGTHSTGMTQTLLQSLAYNVGVSALVAVAISKSNPKPEDKFALITLVAAGFYSVAKGWDLIWTGASVRGTVLDTVDSVAYGLVTAAVFTYVSSFCFGFAWVGVVVRVLIAISFVVACHWRFRLIGARVGAAGRLLALFLLLCVRCLLNGVVVKHLIRGLE
eukprot:m.104640 g.104640  ORF g.104640 m.104640 type:complete len:221 (+) comp15657_c0_seq3:65-727(+)